MQNDSYVVPQPDEQNVFIILDGKAKNTGDQCNIYQTRMLSRGGSGSLLNERFEIVAIKRTYRMAHSTHTGKPVQSV